DGTDENPGAWDVFAYDDESGINYETIKIYIDDTLVGTCFGTYNVPCSLGDHTILVEVMNKHPTHPLCGLLNNTVTIIDDDINPPELSNFIIEFELEFIIISLTALDYSGIEEFEIIINEEVISPLSIEENDNNFIFVVENLWLFKTKMLNIEIQATDGDNDRDVDALSSSICVLFEITIEEMYQFVIWKIEEIKSYINLNLQSQFKHCLIKRLCLAQNSIMKAYNYFEEGKIDCSLFYNKKAINFLWITEMKLKRSCETIESFVIEEFHNIRNCIVFLMGVYLNSEIGSNTADVEINLLNLIDYIEKTLKSNQITCLQHLLKSASLKLDLTMIFLSLGKDPYHLLYCAQVKLQQGISKIDHLLNREKISQNIGEHIKEILTNAIEDIKIMKALF
ncbi:MAG: hypothetical protein ACFFKA_18150, partial [Candidatus Thorarchaeota archaeon]